ncbi:hypothetical protein ABK040_002213 [Willaertia magna]
MINYYNFWNEDEEGDEDYLEFDDENDTEEIINLNNFSESFIDDELFFKLDEEIQFLDYEFENNLCGATDLTIETELDSFLK